MNLPELMNYVEALGAGDPEVLCLASGRLPETKPDEVFLRVLAAGVNRPDLLQRTGLYPPPPDASPVIGLEVAGVVVDLGEKVTELKIGDQVCALTNGAVMQSIAQPPCCSACPGLKAITLSGPQLFRRRTSPSGQTFLPSFISFLDRLSLTLSLSSALPY